METTINKKIIHSNTWFTHWFDSAFYHKLYANRDEKEAAAFIEKLLIELNPAPHATMLDLGCGNGRHSKWLASKGFDVTGIDLAASSIRDARKHQRPSLRFYRQDMRAAFGKQAFDYVFNFFTSFGYFNDPADDNKVVYNISTALKPGGILVMDYMNAVHAEKKLIPEEKKEIDGITYHINRWADEQHIFKKIVIEDGFFDNPLEYTEQVKKFSVVELENLFNRNGLRLVNVFGNYQLAPYEKENSPRIILIAKKIN